MPGPAPTFLIGNFKDMMSAGIADYDISTFKKYGKTYGFFEGSSPVIVTKDVKFIKAVMIKDFSSFVNRRVRSYLNILFKLENSSKFRISMKIN